MQDLTLVGVHDDGEHLVLVDTEGRRFRLPIDESLRSAARRDRSRPLPFRVEADDRMRPREIQARIRAGQTAEDVAQAAGVPLEHVRRYEGPVLAEREYFAQQARRVRVRRSPGTLAAPTLEEVVGQRLSHRAVDPGAATWDAWRSDDGTWTIQITYQAGDRERRARWSYDPHVRHVASLDDEARWLTEPDAPEEPAAPPARRLTPVREAVQPSGSAPAPAVPVAETTVVGSTIDLLEDLRARRGRRTRPASTETEAPAPRDPVSEAIEAHRRRTEPRPDPRSESRPDPRSESRPDPRSEPRPDPRSESATPRSRTPEVTRPGRTRAPESPAGQLPRSSTEPSAPRSGRRAPRDPDVLVLPDDAPLPHDAPQAPAAPPSPADGPRGTDPVAGASAARGANGSPSGTKPSPRRGRPAMPPAVERPVLGGSTPDTASPDSSTVPQDGGPPSDTAVPEDGASPATKPPTRGANRRNRRTSVPSWDDIVFGTRKD